MDETGSIKSTEFKTMIQAVNDIVDRYNRIAPGTSFAAVSFGNKAKIESNLTSNATNFKQTMNDNKKYVDNNSEDIGAALRLCANVTQENSRDRVILLFADGEDEKGEAGQAASELQNQSVTIATVGIGAANATLLQGIASEPDLYIHVTEFRNLSYNIVNITESICLPQPE